jgi:hypothetical protein
MYNAQTRKQLFKSSSYETQCALKLVELMELTKRSEVNDTVCRIWERIKAAKKRIQSDSKRHLPLKTAAFVSSPIPFGHSPIGDSGATDTLIRQSDQHCLSNVKPGGSISVSLPNGSTISSIATGVLDFDVRLPPIPARIFRDDQLDRSLVSLSDYANVRVCPVRKHACAPS